MKIVFTLLLAVFSFTSAKCQDKVPMARHALSLVANGYIWTGDPYVEDGGQFGLKYDWIVNRHCYLSSGLQTFRGYFTVPLEINYATNLARAGVVVGGGFIFHEEDTYFKPAIFPTIHLVARLKSKKSKIFVDLLGKILFSYGYENRAGTYGRIIDRAGWTPSPGIGINIGIFL